MSNGVETNGSHVSTICVPNENQVLDGDVADPIAKASQLRDPEAGHGDARTIQTVRGLVLDCVEQYENGHGGN